uniref:Uncharacterized protein n=1 Tax=Anguilla anguilla TaxID=7936 RepID=A0A0E9W8C7_ANGAN
MECRSGNALVWNARPTWTLNCSMNGTAWASARPVQVCSCPRTQNVESMKQP